MKQATIALCVLIAIGLGVYVFFTNSSDTVVTPPASETQKTVSEGMPVPSSDVEEQIVEEEVTNPAESVIGTSVGGLPITAHHYGTGADEILFIGGIHGGYEWNTVLVAYELMDYLEKNPESIPENVKVTVIPVLNPDGLKSVVGTTEQFTRADVPTSAEATIPGRFNGNDVDLNRNFDCDWQASGTWQKTKVSGGSRAFSEPESQAIKKYESEHELTAVVVWYSAAGGVFASNCHAEVSPETLALTNTYAKASGYPAYESFDFYAITGDMVNWFAKMGVPAISVLLTTHDDTEWSKNLAGVMAVLKSYRR